MKLQSDAMLTDDMPAAETLRVQVSALVDGELDEATIERTIDALLASDELACFWADAHRAGDWLRSDEVVGIGDGQSLMRRIAAELAAEPTVLAPRSTRRSRGFWIRTGLPGASVAAALVVVAWVATPFGRGENGDKLASAQPTVLIVPSTVAGQQQGVQQTALKTVDPDRLSEYLAAHRDVTPFAYRGAASARPAMYTAPADAKATQR